MTKEIKNPDYFIVKKSFALGISAVLFLATLLKLAYLAAGAGDWITAHAPWEYQSLAAHLFREGVLSYDGLIPSAFRLPLYPFLLAFLYALTGHSAPTDTTQIFVANIALNCLTLVFLYWLVRRFFSSSLALLTAWLFAFNPTQLGILYTVGPETLQALQYVLIAWSVLWLWEDPEPILRWCVVGFMIGLSLLCRSTALLLPCFLAIALPMILRGKVGTRKIAALLFCSYMPLAPWIVRNYVQFGRIVPFEDGMGSLALYEGTMGVHGILDDHNLPEPLRTYFFTKDPRVGPPAQKMAIENITRHPIRYASFCLGRLNRLWLHGDWAENIFHLRHSFHGYFERGDWLGMATRAIFKLLYLAFIALAFWGMYAAWPLAPARLLFVMVFYMNINMLTQGEPRYTIPVIPLLCFFSAFGMLNWINRNSSRPLN